MPHTYRFADAARTTVVRDDGATFPWSSVLTPAVVGASLGGFVGEDYRMDGCPMPTDNVKAVAAAEPHSLLKLKGPSNTGKMRRPRAAKAKPKAKPKVRSVLRAKLKALKAAKSKPPGKRKYR